MKEDVGVSFKVGKVESSVFSCLSWWMIEIFWVVNARTVSSSLLVEFLTLLMAPRAKHLSQQDISYVGNASKYVA